MKLTLQNISRIALLVLCLAVLAAVFAIQFTGSLSGIFERDLGARTGFIPQWVAQCDGHNPELYSPRRCTRLIDCVYTKMTQVQVADAAIGGTRAESVPPGRQNGEVVEWELHFAVLSRTATWRHVLAKIIGDLVMTVCTAVLVWKVWAINKAVMVPWKCENPVMAFSWTMGWMLWVVLAVLLLHAMVIEIRFEHPDG
ncbi:hypothetical protein B0H66DRAFT_631543 [Apodospora peruviana]|uniref:Uncharacterized protein n=1 Tax=Apodospora peruviana TaxID=516989 RepID=A0AAE0HUD9_9PEZI|nr:hypothetical protein B0H66DRAFT_631543 [Apodospora peruviana]